MKKHINSFELPKEVKEYASEKDLLNDFISNKENIGISNLSFWWIVTVILTSKVQIVVQITLILPSFFLIPTDTRKFVPLIFLGLSSFTAFMFFYICKTIIKSIYEGSFKKYDKNKNFSYFKSIIAISLIPRNYVSQKHLLSMALENFNIKITPVLNPIVKNIKISDDDIPKRIFLTVIFLILTVILSYFTLLGVSWYFIQTTNNY